MNRIPSSSTMIKSYGYDMDSRTLEIEFERDGAIFSYLDVPVDIYYQFAEAYSKGSFFHYNIKDVYEYE